MVRNICHNLLVKTRGPQVRKGHVDGDPIAQVAMATINNVSVL